jgi:hypothetical protein
MAGKLTYRLSENEYVAANRLAWVRQTTHRKRTIWLWTLAYDLGVSALLLLLGVSWVFALSVALVTLGIAAVVDAERERRGERDLPERCSRLYHQQPALLGSLWCDWNEAGLAHDESGRVAWNAMRGWSEGAAFFLLHLRQGFVVVPRRALSAAQDRDLRATLLASAARQFTDGPATA